MWNSLSNLSAVRVCEAYLDRRAGTGIFAFVSAEDIFRPLISARYIETKREAELRITRLLTRHSNRHRGVYMRPSEFSSFTVLVSYLYVRSRIPRALPPTHNPHRRIAGSLCIPTCKGTTRNSVSIQGTPISRRRNLAAGSEREDRNKCFRILFPGEHG